MAEFERKWLRHDTPDWVEDGAVFFLTLNLADRGTGRLSSEEVVASLYEAWEFKHRQRHAFPLLMVIMPDHLHLLCSFAEDPGMTATVTAWKRWTARECGIRWQQGFFDHRLRQEESLEEKANYIRMNPVRAGWSAGRTTGRTPFSGRSPRSGSEASPKPHGWPRLRR